MIKIRVGKYDIFVIFLKILFTYIKRKKSVICGSHMPLIKICNGFLDALAQ